MRLKGLALALMLVAPIAAAQDAATQLNTVVIQASEPGPALWKVRKGDHVLLILGTEPQLRADSRWNGGEARAALQVAQEVLYPPGVTLGADIGFFGKLALMPSLMGARDLPDGQTLQGIVPPESYADWLGLRAKYLKDRDTWEDRRPIFAAFDLYAAAMTHEGLASARTWDVLGKETKKPRTTSARVDVKLDNPRAKVKAFKSAKTSDTRCFIATIGRVESDVALLRARAEAWSAGDIARLRALPTETQYDVCQRDLMGVFFESPQRWNALEAEAKQKWLGNAHAALEHNTVTFATLPFKELIAPDGLVAKLAAQGYVVEAPGS